MAARRSISACGPISPATARSSAAADRSPASPAGPRSSRSDPANKGTPGYAYVNGTLHGNPVGAAAGLATLAELRAPGFYRTLHARARDLTAACQKVLNRHNLPALAIGEASLWQIMFTGAPPRNHADIMAADMARTRALDMALLKNGLYVLPSVRRFVSAVHTDADFEATVKALDAACRRPGRER